MILRIIDLWDANDFEKKLGNSVHLFRWFSKIKMSFEVLNPPNYRDVLFRNWISGVEVTAEN